jgi:hypothetical protein
MQRNKLVIPIIILILFCVCLTFAGGLGLGFGVSDTFQTIISNQSIIPAAETAAHEPPQRPAQQGRLLLADDFSQERWKVHSDSEHRKGYVDGQYFIAVDAQEYSYWSLAGENYQDFVLEVETIHLDGPDNNDYGVVLRHQDDANFYSFEISSDGYYTFTKLVGDELFDVIPWQQSRAIKQNSARNMLRVEAIGPNFTFFINDELVDAAIDSDLGQGDIGLVAGTYQDPGIRIAFDNLKVWAVE